MPSRHNPRDTLRHIIENAERVATYLSDTEKATFAASGALRDAVERCLERVCEAAHRLGADAERLMPGQLWREIRGMGNHLRHAYDRLYSDILWNTARFRLPELADAARRAMDELSDN